MINSRAFYSFHIAYKGKKNIIKGNGQISKNQSTAFAVFLAAIFLFEALLTLLPNGILITGHEGDLLHMVDAGVRMSMGETPHLDFMTPIGILGFAPFALFLEFGFAAGRSAILANLLICLVLLPATWWIGSTRLPPVLAWLFGASIVILCTAMVHGNGSTSIGFSMFYNRWCWAVTLIVLTVLLIHPGRGHKWIDPVIVGLGLSFLALTKMTFFVSLVPVILLILLSGKKFHFGVVSIATGAITALGVTLYMGIDFVLGYANDLMTVANGGGGRSYPGLDIGGVLSDPSMISASLVLFGSIIFFRKTGRMRQGLVLLLLAPAFVYITFQNWGNDPKWLYFLIMFLAVYLPRDMEKKFMGKPAPVVGVVLIAIASTAALPSIVSLAASTPRAAFASKKDAVQIPLPAELADLWMPENRIYVTRKSLNLIDVTPDQEDEKAYINGAALPECKIEGGFIAATYAMAREIQASEALAGQQVLTADILNVGWLMADFEPVIGAAVWYYDDHSGFDAATYLAVPHCPLRLGSRNAMVEKLQESGRSLEMRYSSEFMTLFRIEQLP